MLKLKHVVHPIRTAHIATRRLAAQIDMRRFASHSEQHFRGDFRYDLKNVTEGFASRIDASSDDTALLKRVCRAYARTISHPEAALACYGPTEWWKELRQTCLGPVMRALQEADIGALRPMYANFFRDRCATGLIGVPYGMSKAYFQGPMLDVHRRSYIGDALYRIDYWLSLTCGRFGLPDLAGPGVGNPFGISIDGTLIQSGSEYHHYCAHKILSRLGTAPSVVIGEIGGGYGGMAYYLLRDGGGRLTYIDFDVPESLALTSYYLLKALPGLEFLLYGEKDLTAEALAASDIVLLPLFEMARIPVGTLNLTFSSHTIGNLSDDALAEYLGAITGMTREYLLYLGDSRAAERLSSLGRRQFRLLEARSTGWNRHKAPKAREVESLYRLCRD
jgi:hypothetical protein